MAGAEAEEKGGSDGRPPRPPLAPSSAPPCEDHVFALAPLRNPCDGMRGCSVTARFRNSPRARALKSGGL
eukprot:1125523-Prorocentrum_minimum.AAC.1